MSRHAPQRGGFLLRSSLRFFDDVLVLVSRFPREWHRQTTYHSARLARLVVALLAMFLDDDFEFVVATTLLPGVRIRTLIKCGCVFAQASAFCLVSKKRSMTTALRSSASRPDERAALRLIISGPLSTATHVASPTTTLL